MAIIELTVNTPGVLQNTLYNMLYNFSNSFGNFILPCVVRKFNFCELPFIFILSCRENFKVDNILKRVESEHKKDAQEERYHTNDSLYPYDRWIVYTGMDN